MPEKKEVQARIVSVNNNKATEEDLISFLRLVSPGTNLRSALDGIVKGGKGALIVVGNEMTSSIVDGGFKLNCRFTPQKLIELSKMDGAIILSKDMKRVMYANALMTPDHKIPTHETGTRHKAAERTAKMTGTLVICVSERKKEINLYFKNLKYLLKDTSEVLRKATEALQILEKQRELFDSYLDSLNNMEINNDLHLTQACKVIQKGTLMQKIVKMHEKSIVELGNESQLIKIRIKELLKGVEKEVNLIIKDYTRLNLKKSRSLINILTYDEIIDPENIVTALAQKEASRIESIKGWRVLSKTSLSEREISSLTENFKNLKEAISAEKKSYEGILGEQTDTFIREIERVKNQY